ncbi:hypothetical protein DPEC_G00229310 [Dallia pectoralis]|uniref:Uncharacterized protein n=1 Tax=Dallia pectoralis TaxID=75939 RepID=A0ACC2G1H4_DALPE|nr:hypothetical protein DPEC_G00229310 [Dallia pectoralis]
MRSRSVPPISIALVGQAWPCYILTCEVPDLCLASPMQRRLLLYSLASLVKGCIKQYVYTSQKLKSMQHKHNLQGGVELGCHCQQTRM